MLSTWDDDPWIAAAYSTRAGRARRVTRWWILSGRSIFAGEHTAGEYASLMEGALRSGLRAAEQVLARHR